jgi:hypothetical protein
VSAWQEAWIAFGAWVVVLAGGTWGWMAVGIRREVTQQCAAVVRQAESLVRTARGQGHGDHE